MNKENVLKLADVIEQGREGMKFDMNHFWQQPARGCGTNACIAGWAAFTFADGPFEECDVSFIAREALGLDMAQGDALFYGGAYPLAAIKKEHAAAVLRRFAETGEIGWEEVMGKAPEDFYIKEEGFLDLDYCYARYIALD